MSDDEEKYLPLKQILANSISPGAEDLLEIDRRIERLEKEKTDVENSSRLLPGRKTKLETINGKLNQLLLAKSVAREHVFTDPTKSTIYTQQKKLQAVEQQRHEALAASRAAAAASTKPTPEPIRTELKDYLTKWISTTAAQKTAGAEKEKQDGSEPDPTGG